MIPKVSIIIPLHNAANYITATLQACLAQSYRCLEVLVVENGSTDDSWIRANTIKDQRLKVYQITKANAAAARNFGYKHATGDYIMFLDADDLPAPNKIESQLRALAPYPKGWIASCPWAKFTHNLKEADVEEQQVWTVQDPLQWCLQSMTGGGMMIPGCWLIPRSIIETSGLWDERLSLHDDGEFMCRVLLASKGNVFVKDTKVYYRQVADSLSRQNHSLKAAKSALAVCKSYEKALLAVKDSQEIRETLAYNYKRFIYEFHPNHKNLLQEAQERLVHLDAKNVPLVGGGNFKRLARIVGFYNALLLRMCGRRIKRSLQLNT